MDNWGYFTPINGVITTLLITGFPATPTLGKYQKPTCAQSWRFTPRSPNPIPSMYGIYGIFIYIWLIFMVNVGRIHHTLMDGIGIDSLQPIHAGNLFSVW